MCRIFILLLLCSGCASHDRASIEGKGAHHTSTGFTNPHIEDPQKSFFDFLQMRFLGDEQWADHAALAAQVPVNQFNLNKALTPSDKPQISWLGHATFLIQYKGINILTDPIFSDRASPLCFAGPKRYTPHVLDYAQLPEIHAVVISHNHYDHLDQKTVSLLSGTSTFYVPLGIGQWLLDNGVDKRDIIELDWGELQQSADLTIQALPSQHWSARGLGDRFATLWASWSIKIADLHIWFAGDTGYNNIQFNQIGQSHTDIDLALIPIGAYAPRWFMQTYHVNPEEAVQIHLDIGAKKSIGMHWGTFPLTAEEPGEPPERLEQAVKNSELKSDEFVTLSLGEMIELELD